MYKSQKWKCATRVCRFLTSIAMMNQNTTAFTLTKSSSIAVNSVAFTSYTHTFSDWIAHEDSPIDLLWYFLVLRYAKQRPAYHEILCQKCYELNWVRQFYTRRQHQKALSYNLLSMFLTFVLQIFYHRICCLRILTSWTTTQLQIRTKSIYLSDVFQRRFHRQFWFHYQFFFLLNANWASFLFCKSNWIE